MEKNLSLEYPCPFYIFFFFIILFFFFLLDTSYETPCSLFRHQNLSEQVINDVSQIGKVAAVYLHRALQSQIKYGKEAAEAILMPLCQEGLAMLISIRGGF